MPRPQPNDIPIITLDGVDYALRRRLSLFGSPGVSYQFQIFCCEGNVNYCHCWPEGSNEIRSAAGGYRFIASNYFDGTRPVKHEGRTLEEALRAFLLPILEVECSFSREDPLQTVLAVEDAIERVQADLEIAYKQEKSHG